MKDFRDVLADRSIDVVRIATPDHWHAYMTVEACKAGKDVYVEKPLCAGVNEGLKMVEAARKHNRIVEAGTWQRSMGHFLEPVELVKTGKLGKIFQIRTFNYFLNPPPATAICRTPIRRPALTGICGWARSRTPLQFCVAAGSYRKYWDDHA